MVLICFAALRRLASRVCLLIGRCENKKKISFCHRIAATPTQACLLVIGPEITVTSSYLLGGARVPAQLLNIIVTRAERREKYRAAAPRR